MGVLNRNNPGSIKRVGEVFSMSPVREKKDTSIEHQIHLLKSIRSGANGLKSNNGTKNKMSVSRDEASLRKLFKDRSDAI